MLYTQVTQGTGTSELLEHPEGPAAGQELEHSVLCPGTAVPLLPLGAPHRGRDRRVQRSSHSLHF